MRGFSAVDAGNVRLDGLYFDRQTDPSTLLVPSSTMRVGISAQGYVLPAPTGIVDYQLARAGDQLRISPVVGYGPFDGFFAELESELPVVTNTSAIAGGFSYFEDAFESGSDERGYSSPSRRAGVPAIDRDHSVLQPRRPRTTRLSR